MNRRDFLKGLSAIVPASLLARFEIPEAEAAIVEVVEPDVIDGVWFQNGGRIQTEAEREFKSFGGYFASTRTDDPIYRPSSTIPNKWDVIDLSQDE